MRRRAFDLILLLATIVGGGLAWDSGRERSRLSKESARLSRVGGSVTVGDSSLVHLVAMETGEPLHFAWRAFFPADYPGKLTTSRSNQSLPSSYMPSMAILRVRFREDDQGILNVYMNGAGGRSREKLGDKALADLLRGRWGEIQVEQIGAKDVAVFAPDKSATLLKLTLPEMMQGEAKAKLSGGALKDCVPILYEQKLGTVQP